MNFPNCNVHVQNHNGWILQKMLLYQYFVKHATKIQIKQTKSISDANNSLAMPVYSLLWTIFFQYAWTEFDKDVTLLEVMLVCTLGLIL